MLEKVDLSKRIEKKDYKVSLKVESEKLSLLQRRCQTAQIPVMIVFEGFSAAGKGTQINRVIQPLDPRGFLVHASSKTTEEEKMRPFLWRYWIKVPARGRIAIFDRSWYRSVFSDRFDKLIQENQVGNAFADIKSFEKQLIDDGIVIIKFFLHITNEEQAKRFRSLEASKETAWRVTEEDWDKNRDYGRYLNMGEELLERTDTEYAPWTIVEAMDKNYATIKILSTITATLENELDKREKQAEMSPQKAGPATAPYQVKVLSGVDLTKSIGKKEYKQDLDNLQKRIELLHSELYRQRIPMVLAFEGWDAAGKGGAIKRLTSHLDPRGYAVFPTAAPNDYEKVHHYLWRFWNNMPKAGHIAIFDRTWYGRVMVERIEGFCTEAEWKRAYQEINEMEKHIANFGTIVLKFWLQIDKDEQERRFHERMDNPAKQWKITEEDWRNREKWDAYEEAVDEMLLKTSTTCAPWTIVEADSKYYARLKVLRTVVEAMEARLK